MTREETDDVLEEFLESPYNVRAMADEIVTLRAQLADEATARDNLLLQTICRLPDVLTHGSWEGYLAEYRDQWLNDDRAFGGWVAQRITAYIDSQLAGVREQSRLREIDCAIQEARANTAEERLTHMRSTLERLTRYSLAWGCGPTLDADDNGDYLSRDDVLAALGGDA